MCISNLPKIGQARLFNVFNCKLNFYYEIKYFESKSKINFTHKLQVRKPDRNFYKFDFCKNV